MTTVLQHNDDVSNAGDLPPIGAVVLSDGTYLLQVLVPDGEGGEGLDLQRYAADGTPLGDTVGLDGVPGFDTYWVVALDEGYMVVSQHDEFVLGSQNFVMSRQVYAADGSPVGDSMGITPYSTLMAGSVHTIELDGGNILVAYVWNSRTQLEVYGQDGQAISAAAVADVTPYATLRVAALDGGGYVATWNSTDGNVYARVFDQDSIALGAAMRLNPDDSPTWHLPAAISRWDDGGFITVWSSGPAEHLLLNVQAYDVNGMPVGAVTQLGTGNDANGGAQIAALSDGGYVVTWTARQVGSDDGDIHARRFDAHGNPVGFEFTVNTETEGNQFADPYYDLLKATPDGGFIMNWIVSYTNGQPDTYHSSFSATGSLSGANYLFGTWAHDVLNGGAGADIMAGGVGNDTYYVDNAGDQVQENAESGVDLVKASLTWRLGDNVEDLVLTGSGNINGYGNELNNRLTGNTGANVLIGGDGNDTLYGAAGNDSMYGGAGNDTYYVDSLGDRVDESLGGGMDTVRSSVDFSMGAGIENLTLTGTGDLRAFGNDLNNTITGTSGANVLLGRGGNDMLNGGAGADRMYGGTGDDTFYVDDAGDRVYEAAGEGYDRVLSSVSFGINSQSIEYVILTGTADIDASGNIGNDRLTGNGGANTLKGGDGDDRLDGGAGSDILTGGRGADIFYFGLGSGADTITDFKLSENDRIDLRAWDHVVQFTQSGSDVIVDLGGGNTITVLHASLGDVAGNIMI